VLQNQEEKKGGKGYSQMERGLRGADRPPYDQFVLRFYKTKPVEFEANTGAQEYWKRGVNGVPLERKKTNLQGTQGDETG